MESLHTIPKGWAPCKAFLLEPNYLASPKPARSSRQLSRLGHLSLPYKQPNFAHLHAQPPSYPGTTLPPCFAQHLTVVKMWDHKLHATLASNALYIIHGLTYSLRFISKVTFGHNLRYETKDTFGEISLKLRQTNWNVARNNVNVVDDELRTKSIN